MKTRLLFAVVVAAVVAVAAVWLASRLRHRDERQIQKTLDTIVAQVSKSGPEGEIVALGKAVKAAGFFSRTPDIVPPAPIGRRIEDPEILRGVIHQARLSLERIRIRLLERTLRIDTQNGTASMDVAAQVRVESAGQWGEEVYRFTLGWVREDGHWRIRTVRLADTIQAPPGLPPI